MTTRSEILNTQKAAERLHNLVIAMNEYKEIMTDSQRDLTRLLNSTENSPATQCEIRLFINGALDFKIRSNTTSEVIYIEKIQSLIAEVLASRIAYGMKKVHELAAEIAS